MTPEKLQEIEARAKAATGGPWGVEGEPGHESLVTQGGITPRDIEFIAAARADVPALTAALREAWAARNVAELWQERGIAEWQGAVEMLQAENERLRARIAELECLLISWHYGPTMQDTSNAFRSLKEIAKDLAADALEETNDA